MEVMAIASTWPCRTVRGSAIDVWVAHGARLPEADFCHVSKVTPGSLITQAHQ
jgi:hypothetical protein